MNEGRVEICSNGVWGTINGGGWDSRDAKVVCKQLGLYQPYSSKQVHCPTDLNSRGLSMPIFMGA